MVADGDDVPQWLRDGDYTFDYHLDTAALIRSCEQYASLAAISRASGVNERQFEPLCQMVSRRPRGTASRERIVEGLHEIGRRLIAVV